MAVHRLNYSLLLTLQRAWRLRQSESALLEQKRGFEQDDLASDAFKILSASEKKCYSQSRVRLLGDFSELRRYSPCDMTSVKADGERSDGDEIFLVTFDSCLRSSSIALIMCSLEYASTGVVKLKLLTTISSNSNIIKMSDWDQRLKIG